MDDGRRKTSGASPLAELADGRNDGRTHSFRVVCPVPRPQLGTWTARAPAPAQRASRLWRNGYDVSMLGALQASKIESWQQSTSSGVGEGQRRKTMNVVPSMKQTGTLKVRRGPLFLSQKYLAVRRSWLQSNSTRLSAQLTRQTSPRYIESSPSASPGTCPAPAGLDH